MPQEIGYQRQLRPQAAEAMPLASPASFGAELGAKIEQVGEQIDRNRIAAYQTERRHTAAEEWSGFQRANVQARTQFDQTIRDLRAEGGAGHAERVASAFEEYRTVLLDGITEDEVRQRAEATFNEYLGGVARREAEWEDVKRIENTMLDVETFQRTSHNRIARLDSMEDYLAEQEQAHAALRGYDLPEYQYRAVQLEYDQGAALAYMRGQAERNPREAQAMLATGLFDDVLDASQTAMLAIASATEIRALEVAEQRQAAEARAARLAEVRAKVTDQNNGVPLDDEEWAGIESDPFVQADPGVLAAVKQARAEAGFVRVHSDATPQETETRMRELVGLGDNGRSEAQNRELAWLQRTQPGRQSAYDNDRAAYLQRRSPAPELVWGDAASGAAVQRWREVQADVTGGYVAPITDAQAGPVRDLLERGQTAQALAMLDTFTDARTRLDAAQTIAPENALFHRLSVMPARLRNQVEQGNAAMRADGALMRTEEGGAARSAQSAIRNSFQQALGSLPVEDREAIWQAALALTANSLATTGTSLEEAFAARPDGMRRVLETNVQLALGGKIAQFGGSSFVLDSSLTYSQWGDRMVADLQRQIAAGTGPVNEGDGSRANPFQPGVTRPVWLGGTRYQWETRTGRVLRRADGTIFISNVGAAAQ